MDIFEEFKRPGPMKSRRQGALSFRGGTALVSLLFSALLVTLLAGCNPALQTKTYPDSPWRTVYGTRGAIDTFCAERLGRVKYGGRWGGCYLPRERIIACTDAESCLHEAVHTADAKWGPRHDGRAPSTVTLPFQPAGKRYYKK